MNRRAFLQSLALCGSVTPVADATTLLGEPLQLSGLARNAPRLRITDMETFVVRATERTNWIFVRLLTNQGLTGLGEASLGCRTGLSVLRLFFELIRNQSPFAIAQYRQRGLARAAAGDRQVATAFSALEQAQWDLVGKALGAPVYELFGGALRHQLLVYANINRATRDRTPTGFAEQAAAVVEDGTGFAAIKAVPFDGFPPLTATQEEVDAAADLGIACVEAMRRSAGSSVAIKIDCHSVFDTELAIAVARQLEPQQLSWYEEPVSPLQVDQTREIKEGITQPMAGGEFLFGMQGFDPLCRHHAVDIIMPDVKHCGGLQEARNISALAALHHIKVSPHNPSGPVSTAASAHLCAGMPNFDILEYQWGEVEWRGDLISPPERFQNGYLAVPDQPGLGIELNDAGVTQHLEL